MLNFTEQTGSGAVIVLWPNPEMPLFGGKNAFGHNSVNFWNFWTILGSLKSSQQGLSSWRSRQCARSAWKKLQALLLAVFSTVFSFKMTQLVHRLFLSRTKARHALMLMVQMIVPEWHSSGLVPPPVNWTVQIKMFSQLHSSVQQNK